MNPTNYKRTKIIKFDESPKIQNIFSIIKIIEDYLNNKSSNLLTDFLILGKINSKPDIKELSHNDESSKANEKILQVKLLKIKKVFEKFDCDYFCLELKFAKIFDNVTQLFFFYSEYNDINNLALEFHQFEKFEKYENYICNRNALIEEKKEYLKPIFIDKFQYKLFDNIYYIKKQYNIQSFLANDNHLNYSILKNLFFILLEIINPRIFKELFGLNIFYELEDSNENNYKISNIKFSDCIKLKYQELFENINNQNYHKDLIDKLLIFDYNKINDSFLSKFTPAYNACYLLNYFAELTEKKKEYSFASFIYNYLLINFYLGKKRGFWWFRLILIYKNYMTKSKKRNENAIQSTNNQQNQNKINNIFNLSTSNSNNNISLKLLKKSSEDKFIKSGYYEKIKTYYENFDKANIKNNVDVDQSNNIKINNKKGKKRKSKNKQSKEITDSFAEKNSHKEKKDLLQEMKKNFKSFEIDENNFTIKVINADSVFNKFSGKRIYSFNNNLGTVEEYALNYYYNLGLNGVHGENKILPCLYNLFLWDVIYFDKVPYVFQSSYQSYPLDFFSSDFYYNRKRLIEERLSEIENYTDNDIKQYIEEIFNKKRNFKTPFVDWKFFMNGKEILTKIAISLTSKKLVKIFEEFAKSLNFIIKGMPDLFLWDEKNLSGSSLLVEVKSINDKLSDHQKYWLKFLKNINVNSEILHIK